MLDNWKILKKETAFKNKWRQVDRWDIQFPDGSQKDFYFTVSPDFVFVIALAADKNIVLINQYFIQSDENVLTLPAGYLDDGETPLATAKRELLEETGYEAKEWMELGTQHAGKWTTNKVHFALALGAYKKGEQDLEVSEYIEVIERSVTDVKEMLRAGKFGEVYAVAGLYLALDYLNKL